MSTAKQQKAAASSSFFSNLFQTGLYKRNQGRISRQVTFAAIWIAASLGAWQVHAIAAANDIVLRLVVPLGIVVLGAWLAYRLVNLPSFADFLISVEAEMTKVTWPTRTELIRGSVVVIFTIFFLAGSLFAFDTVWRLIFMVIFENQGE